MKWRALKKGDLVDLIAPGYSTEESKVEAGIDVLTSWGLQVRRPEEMLRPYYFHAQTDEQREAFAWGAFSAKDSQAVWGVRGGYGCNRLVPGLLKKKAPKLPKLFIGISDLSTLHLLLNDKWKWSTVHGPLLERLGSKTLSDELMQETHDLVFGKKKEIVFKGLQPMNTKAIKAGSIKGKVTGGNLTVLNSSLATRLQLKLTGKILFLEDIGERGYRVDRMLEQFYQAGLFEKCAGVVFGHFLGGDEPSMPGESYIPFALERFAEKVKIPVWSGLEAGHGDHQRPVPLGAIATLSKKTLSVDSGAE